MVNRVFGSEKLEQHLDPVECIGERWFTTKNLANLAF
jgi:hypothetical protein